MANIYDSQVNISAPAPVGVPQMPAAVSTETFGELKNEFHKRAEHLNELDLTNKLNEALIKAYNNNTEDPVGFINEVNAIRKALFSNNLAMTMLSDAFIRAKSKFDSTSTSFSAKVITNYNESIKKQEDGAFNQAVENTYTKLSAFGDSDMGDSQDEESHRQRKGLQAALNERKEQIATLERKGDFLGANRLRMDTQNFFVQHQQRRVVNDEVYRRGVLDGKSSMFEEWLTSEQREIVRKTAEDAEHNALIAATTGGKATPEAKFQQMMELKDILAGDFSPEDIRKAMREWKALGIEEVKIAEVLPALKKSVEKQDGLFVISSPPFLVMARREAKKRLQNVPGKESKLAMAYSDIMDFEEKLKEKNNDFDFSKLSPLDRQKVVNEAVGYAAELAIERSMEMVSKTGAFLDNQNKVNVQKWKPVKR